MKFFYSEGTVEDEGTIENKRFVNKTNEAG